MVASGKLEVPSPKSEVRSRGDGRLVLVVVAAVALVLACRKWDNPLDPTGDNPPTVPSNPSPADSGQVSDTGLVLSWQSHDPDGGDTAYFDVFFDTVSPPRLVRAGWTDTTYRPTNMYGARRYYWRVIAYDSHSDTAFGPFWQFQVVSRLSVTASCGGARLTTAGSGFGSAWQRHPAGSSGRFPPRRPSLPASKVQAYVSASPMGGTSGRLAIQDTLPPSADDGAISIRRAREGR